MGLRLKVRAGLRASLTAVCLGACHFVACAGEDPSAATRSSVPTWTVESTPAVSIGEVDGPTEQVLTNVLSGTVLSDGTIVLQNSLRGLFEIRYYDEGGEHLATVSRWGKGPYEFEFVFGVFPVEGDSVLVVGRDDRFAVFGPRGERVRDGRMGLGPLLPTLVARPVDSIRWVSLESVGERPEPGLHTSLFRVSRRQLDLQRTDTLEVGRGPLTLYEAMSDRPGGVRWVPTPFAPRSSVAAGGGIVWIGHSSTGEIRGYPEDATEPEVVARLPGAPSAVTRADRARSREAYSSHYSGDGWEAHARLAASLEAPDVMPTFGHLQVDRQGMLWVQRYEPPWTEGEQSWAVFGPDGRHVADAIAPSTTLPDCFRRVHAGCADLRGGFLEIGPDHLLVAQRDELGWCG